MPYDENLWADLKDATNSPLESLTESDWQRKFNHPERGFLSLDVNASIYSWHGRFRSSKLRKGAISGIGEV